MRYAHSGSSAIALPKLPSNPSRRLISGFSDVAFSSTFLDVTPNSSALIIAKLTHFTTLNQRSSPCRTTGPSGSLEMISRRTILSWVGEQQSSRVKARGIGRIDVATSADICLDGFIRSGDGDRTICHSVRGKKVSEI